MITQKMAIACVKQCANHEKYIAQLEAHIIKQTERFGELEGASADKKALIARIKKYRELTGCGLMEAKKHVLAMEAIYQLEIK